MRGKRFTFGRIAKLTGLAILVPTTLFLLSAWIGSAIPRNDRSEATDDSVEIMIATNGIHTEIIMPFANEIIDWRGVFPIRDIAAPNRPYTHVSVSWGERVFFLETPTWADVNPLTVVNAMMGGDGVVHVAWYVRPAPDPDVRPLRITRAQYEALTREIKSQLAPSNDRAIYGGYSTHDVFYDAVGTYHLGNTCNQWTADRLAAAGIRTGLWTPLPSGVMKWVPDLPAQ